MKRTTIIYIGRSLTATERKDFKKSHPKYRLAFHIRFPNAGIYISLLALFIALSTLLLKL